MGNINTSAGLASCVEFFFETPTREPELTSIPKVITFVRSLVDLKSGHDSFQKETTARTPRRLLRGFYHGERVSDGKLPARELPLAERVTTQCVLSDFRLPSARDVSASTGHDAPGSYEDKPVRAAGSGRIQPDSDDAGKTKSDHELRAVYQSAFKSVY